MRSSIIIINEDGAKAPILKWFASASEARAEFKTLTPKSGTCELWDSGSGRVRNKKFKVANKLILGKSFEGKTEKPEIKKAVKKAVKKAD